MRNDEELGPRCKKHETPRKGSQKNRKGKGGSARLRQLKKREKRLRNKLKKKGEDLNGLLLFVYGYLFGLIGSKIFKR